MRNFLMIVGKENWTVRGLSVTRLVYLRVQKNLKLPEESLFIVIKKLKKRKKYNI